MIVVAAKQIDSSRQPLPFKRDWWYFAINLVKELHAFLDLACTFRRISSD